MKHAVDWVAALQAASKADQLAFLAENSGLPGPRANVGLVSAVARAADQELVSQLEASDDEYFLMCAAAARGLHADDPSILNHLRAYAVDERWRVREGAALGLQLLGDRDIISLVRIVGHWARDSDPLVQRAAIAAICEPRLLRNPLAVTAARDACKATTARFASCAADRRRASDARTLRQALGYCWSVVIAADPTECLPVFLDLDISAPDVAWIVTENRKKKRLARILQPHA